jgi:hypothetical protein
MKVKVKKVLSSSIDPMIWTITNFAIVMNSKRHTHNTTLEVSFFHNLETRWRSMG